MDRGNGFAGGEGFPPGFVADGLVGTVGFAGPEVCPVVGFCGEAAGLAFGRTSFCPAFIAGFAAGVFAGVLSEGLLAGFSAGFAAGALVPLAGSVFNAADFF